MRFGHFGLWVTLLLCLSSAERLWADILDGGVPNIGDPRLHAWYDGNEAIGADGVEGTPIWPNKQGEDSRDIGNAFGTGDDPQIIEPVPTENGNMALRYQNVVSWQNVEDWGEIGGNPTDGFTGFTVFVAANVRDQDFAYFFTGNQGGGGAEVNAGFGGAAPGMWSLKGNDGTRFESGEVIENALIYHTFTFFSEGIAAHHQAGVLLGADEVGEASLSGFVLGGRQNGGQRATVDFAEVLVYNEVLNDEDRTAVEGYLAEKFFGGTTLACDFNGDSLCGIADLDALLYEGQAQQILDPYDLNSDSVVNLADRDQWYTLAGPENGVVLVPGDTDLDGRVIAADLNNLGGNWQRTDATSVLQGDFNGDGNVNASDLNAIGTNWQHGTAAASAAVPEPSSLFLSLVALVTLSLRRRR